MRLNMNEELEKKLAVKFPKILRDLGGKPEETCMAWGFECGPGWYGLLEEGMSKIQYVCDIAALSGEPAQLVADQIKEKFGTLSFYYHVEGGNELSRKILGDIVDRMERESSRTCEVTGKPGHLCSNNGWLATRCREEARKVGYKASDPGREKYWLELDAKEALPA